MALKDDIKQAIDNSAAEWCNAALVPTDAVDTQVITDRVWAMLEDKIGSVQEKLLRDLGHARTQRDQAVTRENALRETVAQQAAELDHLRGQLAAQQ